MKQQTNNNTEKQTVTEMPLKIEPLKKNPTDYCMK